MKRISIPAFSGMLVMLIGLTVMVGWWTKILVLVTFLPDSMSMVFNAAVCFVLAGLALVLAEIAPRLQKKIYVSLGALIFLSGAVTLSEYVFHLNFGTDELLQPAWLHDHQPYPGRMAINTALGFILTGLAFMLLPFTKTRVLGFIEQVFIYGILLLGLSVLLGYLLKLDFLYSWYQLTRMACHTSFAFILLSIGLQWVWSGTESYQNLFQKREEKKILIVSAVILLTIVAIAGVAGFSTSGKRDEALLQKFMHQTMINKQNIFRSALVRPLNEMAGINQQKVLQTILTNKSLDATQRNVLITKLLFTESFTAIRIVDERGQLSYAQGTLLEHPEFAFSIKYPYSATLFWHEGWVVRLTSNLVKDNHRIGTLIAEWPLDSANELFANHEFFLCMLDQTNQVVCLPKNASAEPYSVFSSVRAQIKLSNAMRSVRQAFITGQDYSQHMVLALYNYDSTLGLGFLLTANTSEIYQPMRQQLELVLPIMLFSIWFGIFLLYWQVQPLINQIIKAREQALDNQHRLHNTLTKVAESENRFRALFDSAATGMALTTLEGKWLRVNPALSQILGYTETELLKLGMVNVTHPDDVALCKLTREKLIKGNKDSDRVELRYFLKNGEMIWVLLNMALVRDSFGYPTYFITQTQDITEKKKAELELTYRAYYDALTGLVNRNQLQQSLDQSIALALRSQKNFAVFFIDIDHFKQINDSLGHDAGDELLKVIAERLKNSTRVTDVAARIGGDEFILILNGIDNSQTAAVLAEKIISTILQPITIKEHEIYIAVSIGISFYPADGMDFNSLIKSADLALYHAKELGRNNYQFCTTEMNAEIKEKAMFNSVLQKALERKEFYLDYLPKLDMKNRSIVGAEALLRLQSKEYGAVSPARIIPMAEESGFIIPLSEWIIHAACEQTSTWLRKGFSNLHIAINLSSRQFKQSNIARSVAQALKEAGLSPHSLELEITENLVMQDPEFSFRVIEQLKALGVQITIDNFGTGYSSLSYLQRFNVDRIKIDRSLISKVVENKAQEALVGTLIGIAKNLKIKVVAEGVETHEQFEWLKAHGCDEVQGYFISQPLEGRKMTSFLEAFSSTASGATES